MSWGFVAGAAITAVGGVVSANQAKKGAGKTAPPIDIGDVSKTAIQANIENMPDIEALLKQSNKFQQRQNLSLLEQAVPGYSGISSNLAGIAAESSANPYALPKDFTDNLTRLAAERGINTGVRGQANDYSLLRDFGVNSLQFGQQRIGQAQSIVSMLAGLGKVNPLSPLSFMTSPDAALAAASGNQALQQSSINAQQSAKNYANASMVNSFSQFAGQAMGAYSGYQQNQNAGKGGAMTYDSYLQQNPNSTAARGY